MGEGLREGPEVLPDGGVDFLGVEKSSGPAKDTSVVLSKGTVTSTPYAGDAQILMELQPTYSNKREDAEVIATYDVEFRFPDPEYVSRTKRGNWGDVLTEMDDFTWKFLDALDDLGIADDTIVVWTSDNGFDTYYVCRPFTRSCGRSMDRFFGAGRGGPLTSLEGSNRTPNPVRWPGKRMTVV